jgi:hypothetical protein
MLPTKKCFPKFFRKKCFDESPSEDQKYYSTLLALKTLSERKLYGRNGKKTASGPDNRLDEISVKR